MKFVLRRSLPSIGGLIGLLLVIGFAVVFFLGAPMWFPAAFAIVMIGVQYLVNPYIIRWLVPAAVIDHDGERYATDHPVGAIVARRCRDAGIPLVTLGIVDDGNPNAFTFGRTPGDARIWISRGLLERLDHRELDAVVAHEVGHIKHWDFAVMTLAAVVPMVLYLAYLIARGSDRAEARAVALGAYIAYLVSQLTLLALSRARETAADHWSCEITGDGDALASALVKIAYGMGVESAAEKEEIQTLIASGRQGKKEAAKLSARARRARSMRAMGIFEPQSAEAMQYAFAHGIDPDRALAAMRWDLVNPWGATLEKLSSHPLVARRIRALEESGLPGAPRQWSAMRAMAGASPEEIMSAKGRFAKELAIAVAPWVLVVAGLVFGVLPRSQFGLGLAVAVAGLLFFVKQQFRYPADHQPVDEIAGLLERLDAGPITGIPVVVKGQIIGRGVPGYVLSADMVVADDTGFVPLLYRQPLPFVAQLFGLFRAKEFQGKEVVARGWYRRMPGPAIELRDVHALSGRKARSWEWVARYAGSVLLIFAGIAVMLVGLA
ncbi:MAG TPA: zinc metalloprotease HtpX [Acidimicrobiales bacterium]|nr:zinc metalloprotease HtpX [Acidimicrobiales bacterium]